MHDSYHTTHLAGPLLACGIAITAICPSALAQSKTITNPDLKFSIAVPEDCRIEQGPGTLESICDPGRNAALAVDIPKAKAFLLEIDAEQVPTDAKPYTETEFSIEVPDAVCGETASARVTLSNIIVTKDGPSTIMTANVVCPELSFLGLDERKAQVRYIFGTKFRYRLMHRTPSALADSTAAAGKAFFDSFKSTAE